MRKFIASTDAVNRGQVFLFMTLIDGTIVVETPSGCENREIQCSCNVDHDLTRRDVGE